MPTPNTHELFRVVVSVAFGAPEIALPDAMAPIAPDPFVPDVSTFKKVTTVSEDAAACERVAVTVTLPSGAVAMTDCVAASMTVRFPEASSVT